MTGPEPEPDPDLQRDAGSGSGSDRFEGRDADAGSESGRRVPALDVTIEAPPIELAAHLAAWWVALADEQRAHRSHLLGEPNRTLIREAMARHVVTDGLLVARLDPPGALNDDDRFEPFSEPVPESAARDETGNRHPERNRSIGRTIGTPGAEGADDVVGFVMYGPETGSYEQSIDRGIIENVYVHPDYRNRGVGATLLEAAETALAESGVDAIALEVMADNEAARRFYARRGYAPHRLELEASVDRLDAVDEEGESTDGTEATSGDRSAGEESSERSADGTRKR